MAGIITALCGKKTGKKFSNFHCVYNHLELLDTDRRFIENIVRCNNAKVRFTVPDRNLIEVGEKDEVTIIDEFDYVMLDRLA